MQRAPAPVHPAGRDALASEVLAARVAWAARLAAGAQEIDGVASALRRAAHAVSQRGPAGQALQHLTGRVADQVHDLARDCEGLAADVRSLAVR